MGVEVASEVGEAASPWLVLCLLAAAVLVAGFALFLKLRDDRRSRHFR
jgi:hypothetical protein